MEDLHAAWLFHYLKHRDLPYRDVVQVEAKVVEVLPPGTDSVPPLHQLFFVSITNVLDNSNGREIGLRVPTLVALRYGDAAGLASPIPDLRPEEPATIRGMYLPASATRPGPDGAHHPLLHWVHHPLGWIEYQGMRHD